MKFCWLVGAFRTWVFALEWTTPDEDMIKREGVNGCWTLEVRGEEGTGFFAAAALAGAFLVRLAVIGDVS